MGPRTRSISPFPPFCVPNSVRLSTSVENSSSQSDRLVKGMRVAGVKTLEQANQYLADDYLVWRERELTVQAAHPDEPAKR